MEKNLQDKQAIQKLQKLVNEINICMFITRPEGRTKFKANVNNKSR
jgi:hypothetical protein